MRVSGLASRPLAKKWGVGRETVVLPNRGRKRRARTETVDWRTKESLATRRDEACLQDPENAREMRRAVNRKGKQYQ